MMCKHMVIFPKDSKNGSKGLQDGVFTGGHSVEYLRCLTGFGFSYRTRTVSFFPKRLNDLFDYNYTTFKIISMRINFSTVIQSQFKY